MAPCTDAAHRQGDPTPNRQCAGQCGAHADLGRGSSHASRFDLSRRVVFLRFGNARPRGWHARAKYFISWTIASRAKGAGSGSAVPRPRPSSSCTVRIGFPAAGSNRADSSTRSPRTHAKAPLRRPYVSGGESGIHSGHPWPSPCGRLRRAHRQSCRCVEPGWVRPRTALRHIRKSPLAGALRMWRREWDSNPRKV